MAAELPDNVPPPPRSLEIIMVCISAVAVLVATWNLFLPLQPFLRRTQTTKTYFDYVYLFCIVGIWLYSLFTVAVCFMMDEEGMRTHWIVMVFYDWSWYLSSVFYIWFILRRFQLVWAAIQRVETSLTAQKWWIRNMEWLPVGIWFCTGFLVATSNTIAAFFAPHVPNWLATYRDSKGVVLSFSWHSCAQAIDLGVSIYLFRTLNKVAGGIKQDIRGRIPKTDADLEISMGTSASMGPSTTLDSTRKQFSQTPSKEPLAPSKGSSQEVLALLRTTGKGMFIAAFLSLGGSLVHILTEFLLNDPNNIYSYPYRIIRHFTWTVPVYHATFSWMYIRAVRELMSKIQRR
ncbi:uncharacterized protein SPPG_05808 [Spizellomyces punctatus DAOM BR117]|uniref:Uncharacterized protein n=1 Tax=Spizellomyces punctatus (strain DAOM BR117) TaxID=645134 RepID=A0A0L0HCB4_SPIPD|nr:uncharacterized protein SPPG_05808 [Spizellomyces punctatus DAOM BR117]KNC98832.1 hypothetical protein SPPG_05808 [Spizellomyces punctatus DAOM BR117]|eukprot:XP_016606872.1 hypothetical protein SPPG_05808 [Spizellomyces punctatus DAOM BR117]